MIKVRDLQRIFKMENEIIHEQTKDLTQADSLLQPQPGGNCLNWVLGHMLTSQLEIISALAATPPFDPGLVARYDRDSEPIRGEGAGVLQLEELIRLHDLAQLTLNDLFMTMKEEDFEREIQIGERKVELGWRVFFLHFHFTYHIGQLEFLRQLAGKLEKII